VGSIAEQNLYLLELPPQESELSLIQALLTCSNVEWAELNRYVHAVEGQTQSFFVGMDPDAYGTQYAWELIHLAQAHAEATATGVLVAILDTGVDASHEVMAGRALTGFDFLAMSPGAPDIGNSGDDDGDGDVDELVGHGTFLAGIVAAVAPGAMILPVKVLEGDGWGDVFGVAQGIAYAVDSGAGVINLSIATSEPSQTLSDAIAAARAAGSVVVVAAGNDNLSDPGPFPAAYPDAVTVAATDADDEMAEFSNYGQFVDLCAPGVDVVSCFPNGEYAIGQGTSISAAFVSGVAALVRSADLDASPEEVVAAVTAGVVPLEDDDGLLGSGRIDAQQALEELEVPYDLDGDGLVNTNDMMLLLLVWGQTDSEADFDGDGIVGQSDLLEMLLNWS
jgi:subtilisin family serine protease